MNTQTYAALAADILERNKPPPPGIREKIQRTDVWIETLELLNLAAEEKAPPKLLKREVLELGKVYDLEPGPPASGRPPSVGADRESVQLLNLVFAIQAELFVAGGYVARSDVVEEEG